MEITNYLSECIENKRSVLFAKFGDGEYLAANGAKGCNCDRDPYTEKLKRGVIRAFIDIVDHIPNSYIAIWTDESQQMYWKQWVKKEINLADYCSIIMNGKQTEAKVKLLRTIKWSSMKKVYVCNGLMRRAKILLNIDYMITVPLYNWVEYSLEYVLDNCKKALAECGKCIMMTSAGMGAKILLAECAKEYPENIYLDIGSALDQICTKKKSRGYEPEYEESMENVKELIPEDWDAAEYEDIYLAAKYCIGYHVS